MAKTPHDNHYKEGSMPHDERSRMGVIFSENLRDNGEDKQEKACGKRRFKGIAPYDGGKTTCRS
jgi:hypothetical protein